MGIKPKVTPNNVQYGQGEGEANGGSLAHSNSLLLGALVTFLSLLRKRMPAHPGGICQTSGKVNTPELSAVILKPYMGEQCLL